MGAHHGLGPGAAAVLFVSILCHADLGVAVGRVEPPGLLPLLSLGQEAQRTPRGAVLVIEHEGRNRGGNLHVALVTGLLTHNGVSVGIACPVALRTTRGSACTWITLPTARNVITDRSSLFS